MAPHEEKLLEDHVVQLLLGDVRLSNACMEYAGIMGCDITTNPEDEAEQDLLVTFQFEFLRNICNRALND